MRAVVVLIGLILPVGVWAENHEIRAADYKVPCVRQSETWVCAGKLSAEPACVDVDTRRMVCTGTPAEHPYRKARSADKTGRTSRSF